MSDETYELLEEAVRKQIVKMTTLDTSTKEGMDVLKKSTELVNVLVEVDKNIDEFTDKEERRRIEEKKNDAMNEVELSKQKITWQKTALEISKVVVPTVISMIGYNVFQKRVLKFEETGRITSTAGRELHFPKFMK